MGRAGGGRGANAPRARSRSCSAPRRPLAGFCTTRPSARRAERLHRPQHYFTRRAARPAVRSGGERLRVPPHHFLLGFKALPAAPGKTARPTCPIAQAQAPHPSSPVFSKLTYNIWHRSSTSFLLSTGYREYNLEIMCTFPCNKPIF